MISSKIVLVGVVLTVYSTMATVPSKGSTAVCPNAPNERIRSCPKNEEFQCCGPCEQLGCDKRASTVRCFRCPSDCFCKEGYIREWHQPASTYAIPARCIPLQLCPAPLTADRKRNGFIAM
nr:uncharacterized protein LOC115267923 [Aedes albopictus]